MVCRLRRYRQNFKGDRFIVVDIPDEAETLDFLLQFKLFIIPNSSIHWRASHLAEAVQVVAPDKWVFGPHPQPDQYWSVYRDNMIVVDRPVEVN